MQFFLLIAALTWTAASATWRHENEIDRLVNKIMSCNAVPGLSLGVIKNGTILMSKGYGFANEEEKIPMTEKTQVAIASLTKAFTATLLSKLLNKAGLTWDTPVKKILGSDFYLIDDYRTNHVTVADLLAHRVGVPAYDILWSSGKFSKKEIIRRLRFLRTEKPFRTKATYSNLMYILAGEVAEKLGGKPWIDLLEEQLLIPHDLKNTTIVSKCGKYGYDLAKIYYKSNKTGTITNEPRPEKVVRNLQHSWSAASLCSTGSDMLSWMDYIIQSLDKPPNKIFNAMFESQSFYEAILKPDWPVGVFFNFGLGWAVGTIDGYPAFNHYGLLLESYSFITILPHINAGIFSNTNGGHVTNVESLILHHYITKLILDKIPPFSINEMCDTLSKYNYRLKISKIPKNIFGYSSKHHLKQYVGTYGNSLFGNITVTLDMKTMILYLRYSHTHVFELIESQIDHEFYLKYAYEGYGMVCNPKYEDVSAIFDKTNKRLFIPCFGNDIVFIRGFKQPSSLNYASLDSIPVACSVSNGAKIIPHFTVLLFAFICFVLVIL